MQFSLAYFLYPTGHQFVFTSMQEPVIFFACFVSFCRDFGLLFLCFIIIGFLLPHQSESMEIVWGCFGHILPLYGSGMGRLDDDIKLVWGHILPNFGLWEVNGKKRLLPIISMSNENEFPTPLP